jgi:hypothetical protein
MAAELPERLQMYERRGELRASLNSKNDVDLPKYAKALKVHIKKTNGTRKIKRELIDDIIESAESNANKLHKNWMEELIITRLFGDKPQYNKL